jgi:hypothetical protein
MSHSAALVILVIVTVLALFISAPFLYLSRRRKKRGAAALKETQGGVPPRALLGIAAYVAVMFFGFAYAYTEPDTWFGQQMKTGIGRLSFFLVPLLIVVVLSYLLATRKHVKPKEADAKSSA